MAKDLALNFPNMTDMAEASERHYFGIAGSKNLVS